MSSRFGFCVLLLSLSLYALPARAEQAVPASNVNVPAIGDWTPYLRDLQGADKARQEAAAKVFVAAGGRGYAVLAPLLKHNDPEVVKRVTELRQQIDTQSFKLYQEAVAEQGKLQHQALTAAALEKVRQAFMRVAMYAGQPQLRQAAYNSGVELQKTIKEVETAGQQLAALDAQLKATPQKNGLVRAGIQMERAQALKTLHCDSDLLAAALDAAQNSGKEGRFTPAALQLQAEAYTRLEDNSKVEAVCRAILTEYPRSLETKFAHQTLLGQFSTANRWDEAGRQARAFLAAFPVDKDAQDAVLGLLDGLMNEERDYARAGPLADWLVETLPSDRLTADALKDSGGCAEYLAHDYRKAERAYTLLRDRFADVTSPDDMNAALARVQAKAEGKFENEPRETDAGLAGVFARFLKAARARDAKALGTLVPKDAAQEFAERLGDSSEELLPNLVFADFIFKKAETDEAAGKATLRFDYYEASSNKPKALTEEARKEDGQWKICWQDPEEAEEKEAPEKPAPDAKVQQSSPVAPEAKK